MTSRLQQRLVSLIFAIGLFVMPACSHDDGNDSPAGRPSPQLAATEVSVEVGHSVTVAITGVNSERFTVSSTDTRIATATAAQNAVAVEGRAPGQARVTVAFPRLATLTLDVTVTERPATIAPDDMLADRRERFECGTLQLYYDDGGLLVERDSSTGTVTGRDLTGGHVFTFAPGSTSLRAGTQLPAATLTLDGQRIELAQAFVLANEDDKVWYSMTRSDGLTAVCLVVEI